MTTLFESSAYTSLPKYPRCPPPQTSSRFPLVSPTPPDQSLTTAPHPSLAWMAAYASSSGHTERSCVLVSSQKPSSGQSAPPPSVLAPDPELSRDTAASTSATASGARASPGDIDPLSRTVPPSPLPPSPGPPVPSVSPPSCPGPDTGPSFVSEAQSIAPKNAADSHSPRSGVRIVAVVALMGFERPRFASTLQGHVTAARASAGSRWEIDPDGVGCGLVCSRERTRKRTTEHEAAGTDGNPVRWIPVNTALGRYEICGKLAEGGMATVYLGRLRGAHGFARTVALKILKPECAHDANFVDMFIDEANLVAKLAHPNIVQIYELGNEDGQLFIAMEMLFGQSLADVWAECQSRQIRLRGDMVAWIGARVAEGLHHAHDLSDADGASQNVVHRDVNPANIFITYDGHVKLIDFGLVKARRKVSQTAIGVVKGKLAYLSPEQVAGRPVDRRSDVFSLGATLWELSTDQRLFKRDDDVETVNAVREALIPDATLAVADYPSLLWLVLRRALARIRTIATPRHRTLPATSMVWRAPRDPSSRRQRLRTSWSSCSVGTARARWLGCARLRSRPDCCLPPRRPFRRRSSSWPSPRGTILRVGSGEPGRGVSVRRISSRPRRSRRSPASGRTGSTREAHGETLVRRWRCGRRAVDGRGCSLDRAFAIGRTIQSKP